MAEGKSDIYTENPCLGLFMRLHARVILCLCWSIHKKPCGQCRLDIGVMKESGLVVVATGIDPMVAALFETPPRCP